VKFGRHRLRPLHGDVRRQVAVGAAYPGEGLAPQVGIEVHHLHQAMHAGVGAAGAQGGDRDGGKLAERRFQPVLDGLARGLALPALVGGAEVAQAEGDSHDGVIVDEVPGPNGAAPRGAPPCRNG